MAKNAKQQGDDRNARHEQLKALVQDGINSNHISADKAEAELRQYADRLLSEQS